MHCFDVFLFPVVWQQFQRTFSPKNYGHRVPVYLRPALLPSFPATSVVPLPVHMTTRALPFSPFNSPTICGWNRWKLAQYSGQQWLHSHTSTWFRPGVAMCLSSIWSHCMCSFCCWWDAIHHGCSPATPHSTFWVCCFPCKFHSLVFNRFEPVSTWRHLAFFALILAVAVLKHMQTVLSKQEFKKLFIIGGLAAAGLVFGAVVLLTLCGVSCTYIQSHPHSLAVLHEFDFFH